MSSDAAVVASTPTYTHASGQHDGECQACLDEAAMGTGYPICADAQPADDVDPDLAALCAWCGHTVEVAMG